MIRVEHTTIDIVCFIHFVTIRSSVSDDPRGQTLRPLRHFEPVSLRIKWRSAIAIRTIGLLAGKQNRGCYTHDRVVLHGWTVYAFASRVRVSTVMSSSGPNATAASEACAASAPEAKRVCNRSKLKISPEGARASSRPSV